MRITTDDGVALEVSVDGSGPGLLLVHGFTGAKEDFEDHLDTLAEHHTVVAFDHRGHGASDNPPTTEHYSFARLVQDTLCVVDAVGLERFVLLGHSMGGMVARRIALDHPDRLDGLVLMDTSHGPIPGFDREMLQVGATVALEQGKDELRALLDMITPLDTPAYQRTLNEKPGYRESIERKWEGVSEVMWAALILQIADQDDDLDAMRGIDLPTLILVGDQDKPFLKPSRRMHEAISGSTLAVIPDAGHSPQIENSAEWIAAVSDFLAATRAAAGRAA